MNALHRAAPGSVDRSDLVLRGLVGLLVLAGVLATYLAATSFKSSLPALALAAGSSLLCIELCLHRGRVRQHRTSHTVRRRLGHVTARATTPDEFGLEAPLETLPPLGRGLKRSVDIALAGIVLVVALPVLMVAALAISLESRGGVLFSQVRIGAGGQPFRIMKLRTMWAGNDGSRHRAYVAALIAGGGTSREGMYKLVDDDRCTRVGRVLRRFSLDELPQLWNVLRGDMSVVGPRPPLPEEAALYDERARQRLLPRPGLTGLWQVSGRSLLSFDEMVELDVHYWREWSPLLDVRILLRTPKAVLWNRETA